MGSEATRCQSLQVRAALASDAMSGSRRRISRRRSGPREACGSAGDVFALLAPEAPVPSGISPIPPDARGTGMLWIRDLGHWGSIACPVPLYRRIFVTIGAKKFLGWRQETEILDLVFLSG